MLCIITVPACQIPKAFCRLRKRLGSIPGQLRNLLCTKHISLSIHRAEQAGILNLIAAHLIRVDSFHKAPIFDRHCPCCFRHLKIRIFPAHILCKLICEIRCIRIINADDYIRDRAIRSGINIDISILLRNRCIGRKLHRNPKIIQRDHIPLCMLLLRYGNLIFSTGRCDKFLRSHRIVGNHHTGHYCCKKRIPFSTHKLFPPYHFIYIRHKPGTHNYMQSLQPCAIEVLL